MDLVALSEFVCKKMEHELPPFVVYHGVDHTYDVHNSVLRLAKMEKMDTYETNLVEAAAWLHDIGILVRFDDHETTSARMASDILPQFGFNDEEITKVKNMIQCTRLPQAAYTIGEKVLCDADLDYLGRNDFFIIGQKLRLEWELIGNKITLLDWYKLQMDFLNNHRYFTQSAQMLRNERKAQNMAEILQLFNAYYSKK
jgi:uncharacterized protein